ncbi:ciliary neurotrophic factor receptor subunit alpha-like [Myxocyprinus asiaticus]|uniref:ciliary neurotrophic factor receptor subunit alpha-like n=1 Tax=Myxocyprinus asiaticus TaxID=70543 RepID=UPI002223CBE4|nr:ciliary neurotrophic factor receptor subunit alpha-like [Myxocyprinus asiaticus]XP_051539294.1 ciliary neurotrophic factor receptor subunit alpha-like [Myxocyprinus asiaticus]
MPGFVSCPASQLVFGIIVLSSVHIKSEIWTNEVSDVQFGRLGSRVTLTCGGSYSGSPVEWRLNGSSVLPWPTQISEDLLALLNTRHYMEGNYSCHDERGTLLQTIKLRLGHLPHYVNVSCRVPSHNTIYCSWVQTKTTHLPTLFISSYSVKGKGAEPCEQENIGVNECTITNPPIWNSKLLVNITEINPLGSNSTIIQVDFHKLLKPDPPDGITVLQVEGQPTQLLVQWRIPASWPDEFNGAFPLIFSLRYRPIGSSYWSMLETEDNTSLRIMDALVGHLHQIQIRAKDALINHSQWSEWSHVVEARPWINPWEEPTEEPLDFSYSFFNLSFPVRATDKSLDSSLGLNGSLGLLVLLGLFAAVMVAMMLTIIALLWVRQKKRDNVMKQELTSMVKMKSIPI